VRFSYHLAFDRNIGWLTEWEQLSLRGKRIAIAGMGGVGGVYLLTLVRLGIGAFHIADFDRFELVNFNRQIGATIQTLGRPKAEVLEEMARDINPELHIRRFDAGISSEDIDAFLDGVDLFIDGLDFFVLKIRRQLFARCAERRIPAITAAPIGMGVGFIAFTADGMSFEDYFRLEGQPEARQYVRFLMGVAPRGLHRSYLVDKTRVDLAGRKGPSTAAACQLCAGMTAVAATKILLRRGDVKPAPYHHHFDFYRGKFVVTRLPFGNAGPLQSVKVAIAQRIYSRMSKRATASTHAAQALSSPIEEILNVARWAPSGDNAQPWRFRIIDADRVAVRISDQSSQNLYEYRNAEPTLLSAGMLLESIRIAATAWGRAAEWHYGGFDGASHKIMVHFSGLEGPTNPLYPYLTVRSADRRAYRARPLRKSETDALEQTLGKNLVVTWHQGVRNRWQWARLGARATDIRLRIPETFRVHREIIDWDRAHSPDGIPAGTIGLDRMSLKLMRWAMQDWSRMRLLNRLGGVLGAKAQLDYLPGLSSAAFFTLKLSEGRGEPDQRVETLLRAGENIQRFWLTATRLGLAIQPSLAILAFGHYGEDSTAFTAEPSVLGKAKALATGLRKALAGDADHAIFIGRIGEPRARMPFERSTRRPLNELLDGAAAEPP